VGVVVIKEKTLYLIDDHQIEKITPKEARKHLVGGKIELKELIALNFKLPSTLSPQQLPLQVELKMYNEGGLNPQQDYIIDFLSYKFENYYLIEAFAVPKERVIALFSPIAKKIGFIDLIYPKFITYTSLSNHNYLVFYFSKKEAFIAIYQKGSYIGHRAIDSLERVVKEIKLTNLEEVLTQKGLKKENYSPQESLLFEQLYELFFKNIEKVVHTLNFKRSFFGIEEIDKLFVDLDGENIKGKSIPGLVELFLSFGVDGKWEHETLKDSLRIEANYIQYRPQSLNFSIFERKKPLLERDIVKSIALLTFSLGAVGIGAFWLNKKNLALEKEITNKQLQLEKVKKEAMLLAKQIKRLKRENKQLLLKKKEEEKKRQDYLLTLQQIPLFHSYTKNRQQMVNDTVLTLAKYRLTTQLLEQNGSFKLTVDITSPKQEKIAKFIDSLLEKGYTEVKTDKIVKKEGFYESVVKVKR